MLPDRAGRRRLRALAATLLGSPRHGFFIPYRHAGDARPIAYPAFALRLEAALETCLAWLGRAGALIPDLAALDGPAPRPRFDQDWFPRLDAAMAFTIVATCRPRRIVEIGSGHSTRFMAAAIERFGLSTELTCIDPAPRAALTGLPVQHHARLLADADRVLFRQLEAGDVLFVDSSHVAMPGTDVDLLLNEIVPALPSGALVHIHDVFLPDPYPEAWAWRGYNEQLLVAALHGGGLLEPIFASHWSATRLGPAVEAAGLSRLPLRPGAFETSLWSRRC